MKRFLKQLIYGVVYLAVFAGLGYAGYAVLSNPLISCRDGRQNQGEEGIDCGGPCAAVCIPSDLKPIRTVGRVRVFPVRSAEDFRVSILFEMQNENMGLAARNVPYTVTLYGAGSVARGAVRGFSHLYEREIKYVAIPNVSAEGEISRAEVEIGVPEWVKAEDFKKPILIVREVSGKRTEEGIRAEGVVVNGDSVTLPRVTLTALFYDALGRVAAVSTLELETMAPQESRSFSIFHPNDSLINLSRAPLVIADAFRER